MNVVKVTIMDMDMDICTKGRCCPGYGPVTSDGRKRQVEGSLVQVLLRMLLD